MNARVDGRPLVMHILFRLDVGGLENGVVNLVNHMSPATYRHVIVALTEATDFRKRIIRDDVDVIALNKKPGHGAALYPRLFRLVRDLRPAVVHTRNLAALEMSVPAWAAGVPVRIHGEHGWDMSDLSGANPRLQWIRRIYRPFVSHYVTVSRDLERYLHERVGVPPARISQIYNGVDTVRFSPGAARKPIAGCPFADPTLCLFGTVGRMVPVKDPLTFARAFVRMRELAPSLTHTRLVMVGDGPLWQAARETLRRANLVEAAWLPGERSDVPEILRGLDCFVLASLGEGISNTILEAMASGLPVIATAVGGNAELVDDPTTGWLTPPGDPEALAHRMVSATRDRDRMREAGVAGRARAERHFSLEAMTRGYLELYESFRAPVVERAHRVREV